MDIRSRHSQPDMTEALKSDCARVDTIWTQTRDQFGADGPFLFGEWSAADAFYAPVVTRFLTYDLPISEAGAIYCRAVMAHPLMVELAKQAEAEPWMIAYEPEGRRAWLRT